MKYLLFFLLFIANFAVAQSKYVKAQINVTHINCKGGKMPAAVFRAANALIIQDSSRCEIMSFQMTYVRQNKEIITLENIGTNFDKKIIDLIQKAKFGDTFYFDNLKMRCPDDDGWPYISSAIYNIF